MLSSRGAGKAREPGTCETQSLQHRWAVIVNPGLPRGACSGPDPGSALGTTGRSGVLLLRRFQGRCQAGPELLDESGFLGLGALQVPGLDVAEAADFLRDRGERHREVMVLRR